MIEHNEKEKVYEIKTKTNKDGQKDKEEESEMLAADIKSGFLRSSAWENT